MNYSIEPIGFLRADQDGFRAEIAPQYREGLQGLSDFSWVQLVWWFDGCDTPACRANLTETHPYSKGPDELGVFATRSPRRPNPIALSAAYITYIDQENGVIGLSYTDANDMTPLMDVKPYTPSLDRVEEPGAPDWCTHWPKSVEASGEFDWESEFTFHEI